MLNGRNANLAEIKSSYGAHHKNFNEDRLTLAAAKCRPMIVVSNKKCQVYADMYRLVKKRRPTFVRLWVTVKVTKLIDSFATKVSERTCDQFL